MTLGRIKINKTLFRESATPFMLTTQCSHSADGPLKLATIEGSQFSVDLKMRQGTKHCLLLLLI